MDFGLQDKQITARAKAVIQAKDGSTIGQADFTEYMVDDFPYVHLRLQLDASNQVVGAGKHAVHIHETGDCGEDFKCAGGHFDPGPAGNSDPDANHPFHAGDLPNITVDENGHGLLEALTTRVTLSDGPRSILSTSDGTSLMIHDNPDPYTTGESASGHSGGPRIGCGVIEKLND